MSMLVPSLSSPNPHAHAVPITVPASSLSPRLSLCYCSCPCAECCPHPRIVPVSTPMLFPSPCCPSHHGHALPTPVPPPTPVLTPVPMTSPCPCCPHYCPHACPSPQPFQARWHVQVRTRRVPGIPRCWSRWAWMKSSKALPGTSPVTSKVTAEPGSSWVAIASGSSWGERTCQGHVGDTEVGPVSEPGSWQVATVSGFSWSWGMSWSHTGDISRVPKWGHSGDSGEDTLSLSHVGGSTPWFVLRLGDMLGNLTGGYWGHTGDTTVGTCPSP